MSEEESIFGRFAFCSRRGGGEEDRGGGTGLKEGAGEGGGMTEGFGVGGGMVSL